MIGVVQADADQVAHAGHRRAEARAAGDGGQGPRVQLRQLRQDEVARDAVDAQSARAERFECGAARDERRIDSRLGETAAKVTPDAAGADYRDSHAAEITAASPHPSAATPPPPPSNRSASPRARVSRRVPPRDRSQLQRSGALLRECGAKSVLGSVHP